MKREDVNAKIAAHYNTENPRFSYCVGGLRRLSVNPEDQRARRMLLKQGKRFFSQVQSVIFACNKLLDIDVFLDIGSNYGECLVAQPIYSGTKTIGFEANPQLRPFLERTLDLNDDLENTTLCFQALSETPGQTIDFFVDVNWSGKSSAVPIQSAEVSQISVMTTTIDTELDNLPKPDRMLIKIDVEGYEPNVFAGAKITNKTVPNIIYLIEFDTKFIASGGSDPSVFFKSLSEGFDVYQLSPDGLIEAKHPSDLPKQKNGGHHGDLVLLKASDPHFKKMFLEQIARVAPKDLKKRVLE